MFRIKESKYMYIINGRTMDHTRQSNYIYWTQLLTHLLTYLLAYLLTYLLTYILTYLLTYLLTYSLTPWNRFILKKLTGFHPVQKFFAFYGTQRFISAFTLLYYSLPSASSIQSITPHPTAWRSKSHIPFSLLRSYSSISPGMRFSLKIFRNKIRFYGKELLASRLERVP
jgi:hypothetical protein